MRPLAPTKRNSQGNILELILILMAIDLSRFQKSLKNLAIHD